MKSPKSSAEFGCGRNAIHPTPPATGKEVAHVLPCLLLAILPAIHCYVFFQL